MHFWIFLTGPLLFLLVSFVLGSLLTTYSHKSDEISYLVYGRYGKWQTANFIGCGLLTLGLALMLAGTSSDTLNNIYLVQMSAWVLGASLILLRLFPTQPKGQKSYVSAVHKAIFVVSVLIQGTLQILFASSNSDNSLSAYIFVSGLVVLLGMPAMYLWKDYRGFSQRVLVAFIMLWVTIGALIIQP